jgi:hypothetical protein
MKNAVMQWGVRSGGGAYVSFMHALQQGFTSSDKRTQLHKSNFAKKFRPIAHPDRTHESVQSIVKVAPVASPW